MKFAIVTGGSSGLGRAITLQLLKQGLNVIVLGRDKEKLTSFEREEEGNVIPIVAAFDKVDSLSTVTDEIKLHIHEDDELLFVIHNAATELPVKSILDTTVDEFEYAINVNVKSPLILTKNILRTIPFTGRILFISSGLADRAVSGLGVYSMTKSALESMYFSLRKELEEVRIKVGCVRPGVVNTGMQKRLREYSPAIFPAVLQFKKMHADGGLLEPDVVASFVRWLLLDVSDEDFAKKIWNFYLPEDRKSFERSQGVAADKVIV